MDLRFVLVLLSLRLLLGLCQCAFITWRRLPILCRLGTIVVLHHLLERVAVISGMSLGSTMEALIAPVDEAVAAA